MVETYTENNGSSLAKIMADLTAIEAGKNKSHHVLGNEGLMQSLKKVFELG